MMSWIYYGKRPNRYTRKLCSTILGELPTFSRGTMEPTNRVFPTIAQDIY